MDRYLVLLAMLASCGGLSADCDTAQLAFQCHVLEFEQCVEFTGLSTADSRAASDFCDAKHGTFGNIACATEGRIGTCVLPSATPAVNISCSPAATITVRYFPPFATSDARASCAQTPGSVFSPN
jgi:hypothetical protein